MRTLVILASTIWGMFRTSHYGTLVMMSHPGIGSGA
jgi:hypothetical protein